MFAIEKRDLSLLASLCGSINRQQNQAGLYSLSRTVGLVAKPTGKLTFRTTNQSITVIASLPSPNNQEEWSVSVPAARFQAVASHLCRTWPANSVPQEVIGNETIQLGTINNTRFAIYKQDFHCHLSSQRVDAALAAPITDLTTKWEIDANISDWLDALSFLTSHAEREITENWRHQVSFFPDGYAYTSHGVLRLRTLAPTVPECISVPKGSVAPLNCLLRRVTTFLGPTLQNCRVAAIVSGERQYLRFTLASIAIYVTTSSHHFVRESFDSTCQGESVIVADVDRKLLEMRCRLLRPQSEDGLVSIRILSTTPGLGVLDISAERDNIKSHDRFDILIQNERSSLAATAFKVSASGLIKALVQLPGITSTLSVLMKQNAITLSQHDGNTKEIVLGLRRIDSGT